MTEPSQDDPKSTVPETDATEADATEADATEADATEAEDSKPAPAQAKAAGAEGEDVEGPRRRARREREQRRAAQARAISIEDSRREAKRRALGKPVQEAKTLGRGAVRGLKLLMWTAVVAVLVVGLGLLLYFTPVMSTRNVVVTGLGEVTQEEVIAAAGVAPGTPYRFGPGATPVSVDLAGDRCRADPRRGQGLSGRGASFRPGRGGLRDGSATTGGAVPGH